MIQIKKFGIIADINEWLKENEGVEVVDIKTDSGSVVVTAPYLNTSDNNGHPVCLKQGQSYSYSNYLLIYKPCMTHEQTT